MCAYNKKKMCEMGAVHSIADVVQFRRCRLLICGTVLTRHMLGRYRLSLCALQRRVAANARLGKDQDVLQLFPEDSKQSSSKHWNGLHSDEGDAQMPTASLHTALQSCGLCGRGCPVALGRWKRLAGRLRDVQDLQTCGSFTLVEIFKASNWSWDPLGEAHSDGPVASSSKTCEALI